MKASFPRDAPRFPRMVVKVSVADVRRESSHASELMTQAVLGVELEVLRVSRDRSWYLVRLRDAYTGWIRTWSVIPMSRSDLSKRKAGIALQVAKRSVPVMDRPKRSSNILCELVLGTRLPRLAVSGRWNKTRLPDSTLGWVEQSGLEPLPCPRPSASAITDTALRFIGAPYLWGGTTPWGCDCSGLVQTVYSVNGIMLPRDARDQLRATKELLVQAEPGRYYPGDLLFFGQSPLSISHVAISTGGYSFIHCRGCVARGSLKKGEMGYTHGISRLLRAATRPLDGVKKDVDKKKGLP